MVYFLLYLFLEVIISVNISSAIGGVMTFFELLLSAFVGISILVRFRKIFLENMIAVSYNCIDLAQFQRLNLFTPFGAILLIVPGFLTDIAGVLMQLSIFTSMLVNRYDVKSGKWNEETSSQNNIKKDSDVIDVEIVSNHTTIN